MNMLNILLDKQMKLQNELDEKNFQLLKIENKIHECLLICRGLSSTSKGKPFRINNSIAYSLYVGSMSYTYIGLYEWGLSFYGKDCFFDQLKQSMSNIDYSKIAQQVKEIRKNFDTSSRKIETNRNNFGHDFSYLELKNQASIEQFLLELLNVMCDYKLSIRQIGNLIEKQLPYTHHKVEPLVFIIQDIVDQILSGSIGQISFKQIGVSDLNIPTLRSDFYTMIHKNHDKYIVDNIDIENKNSYKDLTSKNLFNEHEPNIFFKMRFEDPIR